MAKINAACVLMRAGSGNTTLAVLLPTVQQVCVLLQGCRF
jgi:hypothetical protein